MTNLELSDALAHDAKLSFHSQHRENVGTQEIYSLFLYQNHQKEFNCFGICMKNCVL